MYQILEAVINNKRRIRNTIGNQTSRDYRKRVKDSSSADPTLFKSQREPYSYVMASYHVEYCIAEAPKAFVPQCGDPFASSFS